MLKQFTNHIKQLQNRYPLTRGRWLLAVSGGVDSVVLCHLAHQAGIPFAIAHCNFGLRGHESQRDEQFVVELAGRLGVQVMVNHFDTEAYATKYRLSIQIAARELRYHWFYNVLGEQWQAGNRNAADLAGSNQQAPVTGGFACLATAHHANDNVETLLLNFFKGTGMAGLHAIVPLQNKTLRPLLPFTKSQIMEYATANGLQYVEDSSNALDKYTRNQLRHQLMPAIRQVFPAADAVLKDNIDRFAEIEILYRQAIDQHKKKLLEVKGEELHLPVLKLKKLPAARTILYEVLREFGFTPPQADEAVHLMDSESGKFLLSPTHRLLKNRGWLIITAHKAISENIVVIDDLETPAAFEGGTLQFSTQQVDDHFVPPALPNIACIDEKLVKLPLLLRRWKQGDYFYPLGMRKKKKLSRFFIDNKLSLAQKGNTWVLEMDKKIVWIVGHRIDDRFKITGSTQKALLITYQPQPNQ